MLDQIAITQILFLDIETVPYLPQYEDMPENMQLLWAKKSKYFIEKEQTPKDVYNRAGIYAEFGKIICISVGFVFKKGKILKFRLKSIAGDDELLLLKEFSTLVHQFCKTGDEIFCAHNGKEFDYPFIARRMLINGVPLPKILDIAGKKPWDVRLLDTLELWKFGDYKHYTSLELLATIFNIPTPKDEIDGSMVAHTFYVEKDLDKIVKYCEKDVLTVAQLLLKYQGKESILQENIEIVKS